MNRPRKPGLWYHICGIFSWIRDAVVEHPKTVTSLLAAALSIGGIGGYTVSEVTTDPLRPITIHDSLARATLEEVRRLAAFTSDGFNQQADRQDNLERVVAMMAEQIGTDKEILRERRRKQYQDSLRRSLFPQVAPAETSALFVAKSSPLPWGGVQ